MHSLGRCDGLPGEGAGRLLLVAPAAFDERMRGRVGARGVHRERSGPMHESRWAPACAGATSSTTRYEPHRQASACASMTVTHAAKALLPDRCAPPATVRRGCASSGGKRPAPGVPCPDRGSRWAPACAGATAGCAASVLWLPLGSRLGPGVLRGTLCADAAKEEHRHAREGGNPATSGVCSKVAGHPPARVRRTARRVTRSQTSSACHASRHAREGGHPATSSACSKVAGHPPARVRRLSSSSRVWPIVPGARVVGMFGRGDVRGSAAEQVRVGLCASGRPTPPVRAGPLPAWLRRGCRR